MHCPSCGTPATSEQQFCRACGMSLESVGKLVAQHAAAPPKTRTNLAKAELEQALVHKMFTLLIWGMIIFGIGLVMLVVNKSFPIGAWFKLLSNLVMVSGIGIGCAGLFDAMMRGARVLGVRSTMEVGGPTDTQSLPTKPIPQELPSVTERTTQLIGVEDSKTNKMMDSDASQ